MIQELIGTHTRVIKSTNPYLIGLNGRVIDETKSMLKISTISGVKSIPKDTSTLEFSRDNDRLVIDGTRLHKRPYDRIGVEI